MIDRARLRDLHGVDLPLHVLEQDYVQALFLQELYRESEGLVFTGGTFLKHAHGLDRFSEDLEFTQYTDLHVEAVLSTAAARLERYGLPATIDRTDRQPNAVLGRLRYEGPLFDGTDRSRGRVELEVSTRDNIVRDPDWRRLFVPYPETRAVTARCLVIEEAFAEKLHALSTRSLGRDLYDCWFLLERGVSIEPDLFERKLAVVDEPAQVTISTTVRAWERELSVQVEHPPAYGDVLETVVDAVEAGGCPSSAPTERAVELRTGLGDRLLTSPLPDVRDSFRHPPRERGRTEGTDGPLRPPRNRTLGRPPGVRW